MRRDVQNLVDDNRHGPETYVRLEYHCYENILQHRFSRTFEDDQELDWNLRAQVRPDFFSEKSLLNNF